jgi:hypothetical protein
MSDKPEETLDVGEEELDLGEEEEQVRTTRESRARRLHSFSLRLVIDTHLLLEGQGKWRS